MEYWEVEIAATRRLIAAHPAEFQSLLSEEESNTTLTVTAQPCASCKHLHLDREGIELAAHLGHDRIGHQALHALWAGGYSTVEQVRGAHAQELGTLQGLGDTGIARIRYSLGLHDLVHDTMTADER